MIISQVKLLRLALGLRAKDVAAEVKISPSYLCKIENNVLNPTQEIIMRLAKLYDVNPRKLL